MLAIAGAGPGCTASATVEGFAGTAAVATTPTFDCVCEVAVDGASADFFSHPSSNGETTISKLANSATESELVWGRANNLILLTIL